MLHDVTIIRSVNDTCSWLFKPSRILFLVHAQPRVMASKSALRSCCTVRLGSTPSGFEAPGLRLLMLLG